MYRKTMAFGRKGVGMTAISAIDIALRDILGKATGQPVFRLLGGRTKRTIPVYASRLYSQPLDALAAETHKARTHSNRRRRARLDAVRVSRSARGAARRLPAVRHESRGRHHAGAQDRGARRVVLDAGRAARRTQLHNYHVVMASLNSPMAEYFPRLWTLNQQRVVRYVFDGESVARDGNIDLRDDVPGLGLTINEAALSRFAAIE